MAMRMLLLAPLLALNSTAAALNGTAAPCHGCGHACDADCNCGACNTHGCKSEQLCLGPCNSGKNAKWCGGGPAPPPPPGPPLPPGPAPPPAPGGVCDACGYGCDDDCHCGRCNEKPGCHTESQCLGTCDSGHNAKWCGAKPPPPGPPLPPPGPPPPVSTWSTAANKLQRNGQDVVLHGLGTTCTEYLLRGIGMPCWVQYNYPQPAALLATLDPRQINAIVGLLTAVASSSVVPSVRIPMTASSWLGKPTQSSRGNAAKYPHLDKQYQGLIQALVEQYSSHGIVAILDLHWDSDDTDQQPMAGKDCVDFCAHCTRALTHALTLSRTRSSDRHALCCAFGAWPQRQGAPSPRPLATTA
jgi:hypothetical protein